jgi:hypothetical protein
MNKLKTFFYKNILKPYGWTCKLDYDYSKNFDIGKHFTSDILNNFFVLFKNRTKYIDRKNEYFLIIYPFKKLSWLALPLLPFMLVHELTHALALRLHLATKYVILLPLLTEIPFIVLLYFPSSPFALLGLFGLIGLTSIFYGDGASYYATKKANKTIPDLRWLYD